MPRTLAGDGRTGKRATPIDREIGERVRERRKELRLTQQALGVAAGVSFQQIQKYENGTNRIGAGRLKELARALQVPVSFFFDGYFEDESDDEAGRIANALRRPGAAELLKYFERIDSPTLAGAVIDLARTLSNEKASRFTPRVVGSN